MRERSGNERSVRVTLRYGREGLDVDLPAARTDVIEPRSEPAADDPAAVLTAALQSPVGTDPLRALAGPGATVAISVCDHTRPQPRREMLEAILRELPHVPPDRITVLVATGTHRPSTPRELEEMLGRDLLARLRVVNHECTTSPVVDLGTVDGDVRVRVNRIWVDADLRISTGFVEPHFFAGFSGGPKMVTPGLAALETVLALHDARRIGSPDATWGITHGNPVHDAIRAAAALAPPHLAFDVLLNRDHAISRAFAGDLDEAHTAACAAAREVAMRAVERPYDVVVTTNAGFPLDQNLYQAVKGMRAASQVVAEGGLIICAAACADGLPQPSAFADQVLRQLEPDQILAEIAAADPPLPDQWQMQVLAMVRRRAQIGLRCDGIDAETLARCGIAAVDDIGATVRAALDRAGPDARVCVLPEGPETIPFLDAMASMGPGS